MAVTEDGRVSNVLLYATGHSSSIIQPWAVPVIVDVDMSAPHTPYESFALALIDGRRTVREIRKESRLQKHEIDGALLTLLEKNVIHLQDVRPTADSEVSNEMVYPTEMTAEDLGENVDPEHLGVRAPFAPIDVPPLEEDTQKISIPEKPTAPPFVAKPLSAEVLLDVKPKPKPITAKMEPRAAKLVEQADKDRERGDYLSAQMNLKLALTFDAKNAELKKMVADISRKVPKDARAPVRVSPVKQLFDQATEMESKGNIDAAIELLERALKVSKEAAIYNRLGVILALHKQDFDQGREMIERAVELAPENQTYAHNLSKILTRAAAIDVEKKSGPGEGKKTGGLFGIFSKKK
jgi:tetratricopeptide (TPR) repeat protein